MKRLTGVLCAVVAGVTAFAPAATAATGAPAGTTTRAALVCGNHAEPVGSDPYRRTFFYGNCTNQAVLANVWSATYSGGPGFEHFVRQVCAPAQQDTLIGESTNHLVFRYFVKDTSGSC